MLDLRCNFAPEVEAPARSRAPRLSQLFLGDLPGVRLAMLSAQEFDRDSRLHEVRDGLCLSAPRAGSCRRPAHDALPRIGFVERLRRMFAAAHCARVVLIATSAFLCSANSALPSPGSSEIQVFNVRFRRLRAQAATR